MPEELHCQEAMLTGKVVDAMNHGPVAGATVVLRETGRWKATTDSGRFDFTHLAPGRYTILVRRVAYTELERSVECSQHGQDSLVFEMQPAAVQSPEVIVRSTRTTTSAQGIAYPSSVETGAHILQQSNVTVPDALNDAPGATLTRDGTWETDVSIRGLSGSNIVTMIDNTRMETAPDISGALSLIDLHDLERVEVVKSPGSVLYGTGAFGGVLNLMTKRSSFTDEPRLTAETTNDLSSVDGGVGQYAAIEGSDDRYALRLSGGWRHAGNTATPEGDIPNSQFLDFNLNGSLGVRTVGNQSLFLSYQRSQAQNTGIPGGAAFLQTARATYTLAKRELFGAEYTIPNLTSDLALITVRLSHQGIDRDVDVVQNPVLTLTPSATHATTSGQIEAKIVLSPTQLLTVGTEIWQRDLNSTRERTNSSTHQITGDQPIPTSSFFSGGVYAQDEWQLLPDRLTLTLGGRYDEIRVTSDETLTPDYIISSGIMNTAPPGQHVLWNGTSSHEGTWSANGSVAYALTQSVDVTSLVSSAFRSPSLEERFEYINLGSVVTVGNPYLQSEQSASVNAGLRVHTGDVRVQADAFYNHLTNLIAFVPGTFEGAKAFIEQNLGKARLYGYEVSIEYTPVSWEVLKGTGAYVRGEDTYDGTNLPQIAPLNGRIESSTMFSNVGTLDVSATTFAEQRNLAAAEILSPGYLVAGADVGSLPLQVDRFSVRFRAGVENIFDRLYQDHLSTLRGVVVFEPGRNYFLSTTIAL